MADLLRSLGKAAWLFSAVLLAGAGCGDAERSSDAPRTVTTGPTATSRPAVLFRDVTAEAGITFVHEHGGTGLRHLPETMGGSAVWLDFDADGRIDLFLGQSGPLPDASDAEPARNALYRNLGDGRFEDVAARAGDVLSTGYGQGACAGDVDGDGDEDLYVTNWGRNVLLRNEGGRFTDVTSESGTGDERWSTSAALFDMDQDGDLDLYVANYVEYELEMAHTMTEGGKGFAAYPHPDRFRASRDTLYRNEGDGRFTDVTAEAGIRDVDGKGLGVAPADLDDDGDEDLYVANDSTPNFLFENLGGGRFTDRTMSSNAAYNADGRTEAGMGIAIGDVDDDLDLDIFVTNLDGETNTLYRNDGGLLFQDVTRRSGLSIESMLFVGFGTGFLDADADGDLDLWVGNGHIIDNVEEIDPGSGVTYAQRSLFFENVGRGRFRELGDALCEALKAPRVVRALAFADYDGDGDLDAAIAQNARPAVLLRNDTARRGEILLVYPLTAAGAPAPGVRVDAVVGGRRMRTASMPYQSYCATHEAVAALAADASVFDEVRLRWPTGEEVVLRNVANGRRVAVRPDGSVEER